MDLVMGVRTEFEWPLCGGTTLSPCALTFRTTRLIRSSTTSAPFSRKFTERLVVTIFAAPVRIFVVKVSVITLGATRKSLTAGLTEYLLDA